MEKRETVKSKPSLSSLNLHFQVSSGSTISYFTLYSYSSPFPTSHINQNSKVQKTKTNTSPKTSPTKC